VAGCQIRAKLSADPGQRLAEILGRRAHFCPFPDA